MVTALVRSCQWRNAFTAKSFPALRPQSQIRVHAWSCSPVRCQLVGLPLCLLQKTCGERLGERDGPCFGLAGVRVPLPQARTRLLVPGLRQGLAGNSPRSSPPSPPRKKPSPSPSSPAAFTPSPCCSADERGAHPGRHGPGPDGRAQHSNGALTVVALAEQAQVRRNALTQRHLDLKEDLYGRVRACGQTPDSEKRLRKQVIKHKELRANDAEELTRLRADVEGLVRTLNQLTLVNQQLRTELATPGGTVRVLPTQPHPPPAREPSTWVRGSGTHASCRPPTRSSARGVQRVVLRTAAPLWSTRRRAGVGCRYQWRGRRPARRTDGPQRGAVRLGRQSPVGLVRQRSQCAGGPASWRGCTRRSPDGRRTTWAPRLVA